MADFPNPSIAPGGISISAGSTNSLFGGITAWSVATPIITQVWVANLALFVPFVVSEWTVVERAIWENGATVNGNVSVGIYDSQQNCVLDSAGSTAETHVAMSGASANQTRAFANTVILTPGQFYIGFSSDSATATLGTYQAAAFAGQWRGMGVFEQTSAYPLPTPTATFAVTTRLFIPSVALIARSVA